MPADITHSKITGTDQTSKYRRYIAGQRTVQNNLFTGDPRHKATVLAHLPAVVAVIIQMRGSLGANRNLYKRNRSLDSDGQPTRQLTFRLGNPRCRAKRHHTTRDQLDRVYRATASESATCGHPCSSVHTTSIGVRCMVNTEAVDTVHRGGRPRRNGNPDSFSALADSTRRRLLAELSISSRTVSELASGLQISQPAVSQHLKLLRETGLVMYYCVGRSHQYRLRTRALYEVRDWVMELERSFLTQAGAPENAGSLGPRPTS